MAVTYFVVKRRDGTYDVLSEDTSTQEAPRKVENMQGVTKKDADDYAERHNEWKGDW
jgi:hypothetical protein